MSLRLRLRLRREELIYSLHAIFDIPTCGKAKIKMIKMRDLPPEYCELPCFNRNTNKIRTSVIVLVTPAILLIVLKFVSFLILGVLYV